MQEVKTKWGQRGNLEMNVQGKPLASLSYKDKKRRLCEWSLGAGSPKES